MSENGLVFVGISDLAGKLRGKALPAKRLSGGNNLNIGWVPTNALISCFNTIGGGPYGSLGDLLIVPAMHTLCTFEASETHTRSHLVLGRVVDLEGRDWPCCTRAILDSAIQRLESVSQLRALVAFEHEFRLANLARSTGDAFSFEGFQAGATFGQELFEAMLKCGLQPEQFIREYGPDQYEVTVTPRDALTAADQAVIFRALARSQAQEHGAEATFTPLFEPDAVGNGVHIHFSLRHSDGSPATYDAHHPRGLSQIMQKMASGIIRYLDVMMALLAPSVISYERLKPHRWSATYNNLGYRDREAALRICPISAADPYAAQNFNLELRAVDAAASPHLALAAVLHAMAQGVEDDLPVPDVTTRDLSDASPEALQSLGLQRLPTSLEDALARFHESAVVRQWMGQEFCDVYRAHKLSEMAYIRELSEADIYRRYSQTY